MRYVYQMREGDSIYLLPQGVLLVKRAPDDTYGTNIEQELEFRTQRNTIPTG